MSKYTYVLKADHRTNSHYDSKWAGKDIPVTVVADTFESAQAEAVRVLSNAPVGVAWTFWIQSITAYESPADPHMAEYAHVIAEATAKIFFKESHPAQVTSSLTSHIELSPESVASLATALATIVDVPAPTYEGLWPPPYEIDPSAFETTAEQLNAHIGGTI